MASEYGYIAKMGRIVYPPHIDNYLIFSTIWHGWNYMRSSIANIGLFSFKLVLTAPMNFQYTTDGQTSSCFLGSNETAKPPPGFMVTGRVV